MSRETTNKRLGKKKPVFVVICNAFGRGIQFRNIFEFGQVASLLRHLKKLKAKLLAVYCKDDAKYQKLIEQLVWDNN